MDTDITVDINLHIIILIFAVLFVTKLAYVPVTLVYTLHIIIDPYLSGCR